MTRERVDVLIVVAHRPELDAVLAQVKEGRAGWTVARDSIGATYHVRDESNARGQAMRIAAAWLGDFGRETASRRSGQLADDLDPRAILMCGGCEGNSTLGSVLGDLIIAERVMDRVAPDSGGTGGDLERVLDLAWKVDAADLAHDSRWRESAQRSRKPSLHAQTTWLLHALLEQEGGGEPPAQHADRKTRCPRWSEAVEQAFRDERARVDEHGTLVLTDAGRSHAQREKLRHPDGLPSDPPMEVHFGALVRVAPGDWARRLKGSGIRNLLGRDSEAIAIASVASHAGRRWLVVKGIERDWDEPPDPDAATQAYDASASFLWTFLHRYFDPAARARPPSDRPEDRTLEPLLLDKLTVSGFKNIADLTLDLAPASKLPGRWTCLAGINGSGKTSVLQAIALALLGDKLAEQLGSVRLARMVRKGTETTGRADITATVRVGGQEQILTLPLADEGVDSARLAAHADVREMRALWDRRARRGILAAYGASRNLSEYLDNRHESLHLEVQRQMTLFDPQARVARAGLLLSDEPRLLPVVGTLRRLLTKVLAGLVEVAEQDSTLRFQIDGALLPASALPDGFRSSIAWLGDLCALWHEKAPPEEIGDGDPALIHGIVLVDEIDLHLHPSLQRVLVPRLREAMPRVQWIVTTHSPLVLASFDRHEIKMLDAAQPGGVRELDRDILGFTMDQIYDWLMDTKPRGVVLEEMLARAGEDPEKREAAATLLATAPDFSEEEAKKRVAWRRGLLEQLRQGAPEPPAGDDKE